MDDNNGRYVTELADRYARLVFATSYRIMGNTHDAEDVLQQVFLKLLSPRRRDVKSDAIRNWGAYLRTMASRAALDLLRAKRQCRLREIPLTDEVNNEQGADYAVSREEEADRLRQALAALPERDALVFSLRYLEELSYEAIAEQTGLNIDLIGVVLHRSRKVLRDIFDQIKVQKRLEEL
jgi:RNA polymerase sigma-70 factor, ECF subfamily